MIWLFLAVAILSAAFAPAAPVQEPEPPEEIRIGDVAEVAEPDNVRDANAPNGWYRKTKHGWIFKSDAAEGDAKPPEAELAAFMNHETMESVGGLACVAILVILVIRARRRRSRRDTLPGNGVSQIQYQALMRQLSGMARILENIVPSEGGGVNMKFVEKKGRTRR